MDYGEELDLSLTQPVRDYTTVAVKYADYRSDDLFTDTRKIWVWVAWKIGRPLRG